MALTMTEVPDSEDVFGKQRVKSFDITLDSSYPSGGYSIPASRLGWSEIRGATVMGGNATAGGYKAHWDTANKKLMVFIAGAGTVTGNVTVVGGGIGEAIGINPDTNAGVLSKAAATNRTIPIATFLGAAPAVAGVANAQASGSLTTVQFRVEFRGI